MKESLWGYWLIVLGMFVIIIMILIQSYTTANTQGYYQLKEVTEASMIDAVDYGYYREYGELKINKEKFVENFLRRFAETINITTTYKIDFYGIYEAPPKATIVISTGTGKFTVVGDAASFDVTNRLSAILEMKIGTEEWEDNYKVPEGASYYVKED